MLTESLSYKGCKFFRNRIISSILSGKSLKIEQIRSDDVEPGLRDFEANFLRLVEKIVNGCKIEIGYTGTTLSFFPGSIQGGVVTHECCNSRSIAYYLEPLLLLAPFSKLPFRLSLHGITSDEYDASVDTLRNVNLKHLEFFGVTGCEIKIKKRGAIPLGGGEILFTCGIVNNLNPVIMISEGRIKRIRGISSTTRVSPQISNRLVQASKSVLNRFIPDIYIYTDVFKGEEAGKSAGFSLSLVAESTTGCLYSIDKIGKAGSTPEEIGVQSAKLLLREISLGGVIDSSHQWFIMFLMALCPQDLSKILFGPLTEYSKSSLVEIESFFGVVFHSKESDKRILMSCMGSGCVNLFRKMQ